MTGYTVHTGSNEKFSEGWDKIFGGKTKSGSAKAAMKAAAAKKKSKRKTKTS